MPEIVKRNTYLLSFNHSFSDRKELRTKSAINLGVSSSVSNLFRRISARVSVVVVSFQESDTDIK